MFCVTVCAFTLCDILNKNTGSKSLYHFVQRLLVPSVRQQVAKPQVLNPDEVPAELYWQNAQNMCHDLGNW